VTTNDTFKRSQQLQHTDVTPVTNGPLSIDTDGNLTVVEHASRHVHDSI
jgi:hypothetical protein